MRDLKYGTYDEMDMKFCKDWNSRLWRVCLDGYNMNQDYIDVNEYINEHYDYGEYSC